MYTDQVLLVLELRLVLVTGDEVGMVFVHLRDVSTATKVSGACLRWTARVCML